MLSRYCEDTDEEGQHHADSGSDHGNAQPQIVGELVAARLMEKDDRHESGGEEDQGRLHQPITPLAWARHVLGFHISNLLRDGVIQRKSTNG